MIQKGVILVKCHPATVERCLCFDDALACLSSMVGVTIGRWFTATQNLPPQRENVLWQRNYAQPRLLRSVTTNVAKIVLGVGALFLWRMVIKTIMPPILSLLLAADTNGKHVAHSPIDPTPSVSGIFSTSVRKRKSQAHDTGTISAYTQTNGDVQFIPFRFPTSEGL